MNNPSDTSIKNGNSYDMKNMYKNINDIKEGAIKIAEKAEQSDLKTYIINIIISIVLFILITVTSASKSINEKGIISIVVIFTVVLIGLMVKNKEFFGQFVKSLGGLKSVAFLIVYNLFLVFFFSILPDEYKNKFAFIILPIVIFVGTILFYSAFTSNKNNGGVGPLELLNLERINYSLIFLALTIFVIILYATNPGGYISKFGGIGILFTLAFYVIGAAYLMTVLRTSAASNLSSSKNAPFTFLGMNPFTIACVVLLVIAAVSILPIILSNNFTSEKTPVHSTIYTLIILFFVTWLISFIKSLFLYSKTDQAFAIEAQKLLESYNKISQTIFLILLGVTTTATLIYWFLKFYDKVIANTSIGNIIIYTVVLIVVCMLIYKVVIETSAYKDSPLFQLIFNSVFYIPCILVSLFDNIVRLIPKNKMTTSISSDVSSGISSGISSGVSKIKQLASAPTPKIYYFIFFIVILLILGYFILPFFLRRFTQQGGKLLINKPIEIKNATPLASYSQLNKSVDNHTYQYGLSFWFYLDSANLSTNSSYETYANILDYGGKPMVTYNASLNTLRVTMIISDNEDDANDKQKYRTNLPKRKVDTNGNIILYERKDILLQKWNNMIINYNGGTLDIFYNGELVKSVNGIIPYYNNNMPQTAIAVAPNVNKNESDEIPITYTGNYDNLIVGQDNGLYGQICNVNYFKNALNIFQIHYLYNSVKNSSPPALISDDRVINLDQNLGFGIGNILGDSTIMGDLPTEEPNKYPDYTGNSDENHKNSYEMAASTSNDKNDFFSLKWYFNANKDNYN
jgi:hypothetical protein